MRHFAVHLSFTIKTYAFVISVSYPYYQSGSYIFPVFIEYLILIRGVPRTVYHARWGFWIVDIRDMYIFVLVLVNTFLLRN